MSRIRLPDGVPPDNQPKTATAFGAAAAEARDFIAPNTALPDFAVPASNAASLSSGRLGDAPALARAPELEARYARVIIQTDDDDDDDEEDDPVVVNHWHPEPSVLILIAMGLLLIAFAAFFMSRGQEQTLPYCSQQPDWNQYNCMAD